jgi:hypothetical protein
LTKKWKVSPPTGTSTRNFCLLSSGSRTTLAPAASAKLAEKQGDVSKLTKAAIVAMLYVDYGDDVSLTKRKKPELVKRLEDKIHGNPSDPATAGKRRGGSRFRKR